MGVPALKQKIRARMSAPRHDDPGMLLELSRCAGGVPSLSEPVGEQKEERKPLVRRRRAVRRCDAWQVVDHGDTNTAIGVS
jgi:hypothetical protein